MPNIIQPLHPIRECRCGTLGMHPCPEDFHELTKTCFHCFEVHFGDDDHLCQDCIDHGIHKHVDDFEVITFTPADHSVAPF